MYKPKESLRWYPKVSVPLRLDDQCLSAVVKLFTATATKIVITLVRNTRQKKALRDYLTINLPTCLQNQIMQKSLDQLAGVQTSLNILDMFQPDKVIKDTLDLLGPFRLGFGCYMKDNHLTWSQGAARKFNLNVEQCDQLYKILLWTDLAKLKNLSLSISRDVITKSKLPNMLGRAHALTRVTLLSGTENHTLRILGINCPNLCHVDVSHSSRVTDQGLRNLLLKNPRQRQVPGNNDESDEDEHIHETNPCAKSLICISLLGTSVTWPGCEFACKFMGFSYFFSALPIVKITRVTSNEIQLRNIPYDPIQPNSSSGTGLLNDEIKAVIVASVENALLDDNLRDLVIDYFPKENRTTQDVVIIRRKTSFQLDLYFKLDASLVTSLYLPWYSFTWKLEAVLAVDTVGMVFPNLKTFRGRLKGKWNQHRYKFLPQLQNAVVWALNSTTGLTILQNAPTLKIFEFNNTTTLEVGDGEPQLSDDTFEQCLSENLGLASNLQEITVRPTGLTMRSLLLLTEKCPNLTRIGDLESWDVTSGEISQFNKHLEEIRSSCVLSVMNFPPSKFCTYALSSI